LNPEPLSDELSSPEAVVMSLINMSVKHGQTLDEARARLEQAVQQVRGQFGPMIQRVEWTNDRNSVKLWGTGFEATMIVDPVHVHASADIPILGGLLGNSLTAGLKGILQNTFQKRLEKPSGS
jgi:hypothetical protein